MPGILGVARPEAIGHHNFLLALAGRILPPAFFVSQDPFPVRHSFYVRLAGARPYTLGPVDIEIIDDSAEEVYSGRTNENGSLTWIVLMEKNVTAGSVINYNPFKIIARRKGYSGSEYFIIASAISFLS